MRRLQRLPYQAMLWEPEEGEPFTHIWYGTTDFHDVKIGQTGTTLEKRMARDGQFKGHHPLFTRACNCTRQRISGRLYCELEIAWRDAHWPDQIKATEQYLPFGHTSVYEALRFIVNHDNPLHRAAYEALGRYGRRSVA